MNAIYLDNAATSFPKPPAVGARMQQYLASVGATVGRSVYGAAQEAGMVQLTLRERLARLFSFDDPTHVVLTPGNTFSLNQIIAGFLRPGDHCLVSAMEHNAVMRPLQALGVAFDRVACDGAGRMDPAGILPLLRPNTRLLIMAHGSNVSGTVQDAASVGEICRQHGVAFCLDAAQTAGHVPVDFAKFQLSALAVPGHKGLLGPSGIGALLLKADFAKQLRPLLCGGTGSASDREEQPDYMPDRFESGTPNIPGIYGLEASLAFLEAVGVDAVADHDRRLSARFLAGVGEIPNVRLCGTQTPEGRVAVFSLDFLTVDNAAAATRLERAFGILTRCGLHCAPAAHRTLGTFPQGTVRFSAGWFTTEEEIDQALEAIAQIAR